MDPYSIFPDDLDQESISSSAAMAAMRSISERSNYAKNLKRDYRIAYSMIQMSQPAENNKYIPNKDFVGTGFVSRGVTEKSKPKLDTSGLTGMLSGEAPDGSSVFELSFDEALLGGMRCSILSHDGVVTAIFHVDNHNTARNVESHLPQLRKMLEGRGLKIDDLIVEVN